MNVNAQDAVDKAVKIPPIQYAMAALFRVTSTFVLVFLLRIFLATFIIIIFMGFNSFAKKMPGIPHDLSMLFQWHWQKVFQGAPSNQHADKIIDKVILLCGMGVDECGKVVACVSLTS